MDQKIEEMWQHENVAILITENIEHIFKPLEQEPERFFLLALSLNSFQEKLLSFSNLKDLTLVILIAKTLYFEHAESLRDFFYNQEYVNSPLFVVVDPVFLKEEITGILQQNDLFVVPDVNPEHLWGQLQLAFKHANSRRKESNYIVDSLTNQVHLKLLERSEQKNKELLMQIRRQSELITSIYEFTNTLNAKGNIEQILHTIIDFIANYTHCRRISIMLLDETGQFLEIRRAIGISPYISETTRIPSDQGLAGRVLKEGKILILNALENESLRGEYSEYDNLIGFPIIILPLIEHDSKLGIINVTDKPENLPFTQSDIEVLTSITHSASIAINNQLNKLRLEDTFLGMIKAMGRAIEAKDCYTRGHSDRVVEICLEVAHNMGLAEEKVKDLRIAAILHDIGKIGIPGVMLRNPLKLTPGEYQKIKQHPLIGDTILKDIKSFKTVRKIIRHHHENFDGSGYPDGLKGNNIPLESRIIAAVDAFDAMVFDRPYRKHLDLDKIISELQRVSGSQLDAYCVNALLQYLHQNRDVFEPSRES